MSGRGGFDGLDVVAPTAPPAPSEPSERALDSEIELITAAMQEHDEMAVADLADAVNAKFWGPGRFPRALRVAADEAGTEGEEFRDSFLVDMNH